MSKFFQLRSYFTYWLDAVDDHSLHSPFFFDLYRNVIHPGNQQHTFQHIELIRKKLLSDTTPVDGVDFGAGSSVLPKSRRVNDIARTSLSTPEFLQRYQRLTEYFHARHVIELGTSLGISSLYLAFAKEVQLTTFEGSPSLAEKGRQIFSEAGKTNIKLIEGNIDTTLPRYLGSCGKVDLVFMDANHRYEPTLRYFNWIVQKVHERSVIIVDDIHYSAEMERAWKEMKAHHLVYGSADLYRSGLLFFDPSLNRQHVILQK